MALQDMPKEDRKIFERFAIWRVPPITNEGSIGCSGCGSCCGGPCASSYEILAYSCSIGCHGCGGCGCSACGSALLQRPYNRKLEDPQ